MTGYMLTALYVPLRKHYFLMTDRCYPLAQKRS